MRMAVGIDPGNDGYIVATVCGQVAYWAQIPRTRISIKTAESDSVYLNQLEKKRSGRRLRRQDDRYKKNFELKPDRKLIFAVTELQDCLQECNDLAIQMGYCGIAVLTERPIVPRSKGRFNPTLTILSVGASRLFIYTALSEFSQREGVCMDWWETSPNSWKAEFIEENPGLDAKEHAVNVANKLIELGEYFPSDDDNACEAALLSHYLETKMTRYLTCQCT